MSDIVHPDRSLFVIIPNLNLWNAQAPGKSQKFLRAASKRLKASTGSDAGFSGLHAGLNVTLVDEVAPKDTVLVAMDENERVKLLQREPGLRLVRAQELEPLWLQRFRLSTTLSISAGAKQALVVNVVDATTGNPLPGVDVIGLSDRTKRIGAQNKTDVEGNAKLLFPHSIELLEAIEAFAPSGYWPAYTLNVNLASGMLVLQCTPINLGNAGVRGHFKLQGEDGDGEGVKVAVVDTGVSRHKDLRITKGRNVVKGERANMFSDALGHGTHVAGIIAGRGKAGKGVRGVAPGVELHAYRVFGEGQETALSFNIAKGIRQAVDDGCDLINLSLGGDTDIPDVLREIHRARAMGVVCLAASGNDYRSAVDYPARYSPVLAVSAMGRQNTWPSKAAQDLEVASPYGSDPLDFIAAFSNVGSEVKLTGPGVGIVSTYPGGYAVMDGTSMACPATTGALARALANNRTVLGRSRDQKRSDAIFKMAMNAAEPLGFQPAFAGAGLLL